MNSTTLASGGGGILAGAIVIIINYVLTFWNIRLPPDVVTALTVIVYFVGQRIISGKFPPPPTAAIPAPPTP
jgi:hypothetical protein